MFLLTALSLGFLGSLHCVGMCGPISLAFAQRGKKLDFWWGRILYNLGRTSSYVILGTLMGIIGQSLYIAGIQQTLSIILGITWLFILLFLPNWETHLIRFPMAKRFFLWLKNNLSNLLKKENQPLMFNVGVLNGFLPCGLVYVALTGAMASQSIGESTLFMMLFGLGTFPAMFALAYLSRWKSNSNTYLKKIVSVASFAFAILLILRGMNLGIPMISPEWIDQTAVVCH